MPVATQRVPEPARSVSRRRRVLFALAVVALAALLPVAVVLAVDVHLHHKYERTAGFNIWGYRGPVAGRKQRDEYRVVVLGGSTAFGYGVDWQESIPAVLEQKLSGRRAGSFARFTVINLAYNNEGAYSFRPTLQDFESLTYDLVCLYEGYNDMMGDPTRPNTSVFRHESPVFRLTGYLPIFPIIFREKASLLRYGDTGAIYTFGSKTVFHPGAAGRAAAETLRVAADVSDSLSRQVDRVAAEPVHQITDFASTGCVYPWQEYCRSVLVATEFALQRHAQVMFVTQPYELGLGDRHVGQQREVASMLQRRFGGNPNVGYVNLGSSVDLQNPRLSFDHMHLTAAGNEIIAAGLVQPVMDMAARRSGDRH